MGVDRNGGRQWTTVGTDEWSMTEALEVWGPVTSDSGRRRLVGCLVRVVDTRGEKGGGCSVTFVPVVALNDLKRSS